MSRTEWIWEEHLACPTLATRNALVEQYLPLVRHQARHVHRYRSLPQSVDVDDLVGVGVLGLIKAIEKFDASRGVKFTTYCIMRVRGSMLDWLRTLDHLSRHARQRCNREGVQAVTVNSLGSMDFEDERQRIFAKSEIVELGLHSREREVVNLYYFEGMTMEQIGRKLGVSQSRISQIHKKLVRRLRTEKTLNLFFKGEFPCSYLAEKSVNASSSISRTACRPARASS
jgi:RNA polymerase sigma factor for flagellar operon FliA